MLLHRLAQRLRCGGCSQEFRSCSLRTVVFLHFGPECNRCSCCRAAFRTWSVRAAKWSSSCYPAMGVLAVPSVVAAVQCFWRCSAELLIVKTIGYPPAVGAPRQARHTKSRMGFVPRVSRVVIARSCRRTRRCGLLHSLRMSMPPIRGWHSLLLLSQLIGWPRRLGGGLASGRNPPTHRSAASIACCESKR